MRGPSGGTPPVISASRRPSGAKERYVITHRPPKLCPRTLQRSAPSAARSSSASRTIASARKCARRRARPACRSAAAPLARAALQKQQERPVAPVGVGDLAREERDLLAVGAP